jgi:hypothetical protein
MVLKQVGKMLWNRFETVHRKLATSPGGCRETGLQTEVPTRAPTGMDILVHHGCLWLAIPNCCLLGL